MTRREKRLKKQEKSLIKQAEKHKIKIKSEPGEKDTTYDYWFGEAKRFEEQARKRAGILKKLKKRDK